MGRRIRKNQIRGWSGKAEVSKINISNESFNKLKQESSITKNQIAPQTINVICKDITYFFTTPQPCSDGEMPWECYWYQNNITPTGQGEYNAFYTIASITATYCYGVDDRNGNGSGAQGGGSNTTPNPPGGYNPCDGNQGPIDVESINGMKVFVAPPTVCDVPAPGGGGGGISNPPISALEACINELQQVFGFSDADKQYLLNYPTVVDDIELSYNNAVIDDDYKAGIRQSMEDLRTGNTLVMNPDTNPNFETNDQRIGGDDPVVDLEYQDQDPWPTINTVIPEKDFVKYNGLNCLILAERQIAKLGYEISPYGIIGSTYKINTSAGVNIAEAKKAANYIKRALSSNIPVIVGVDYQPGHPGNSDGKTDHFVVIVGMGTDSNGKYFRFFDSATANLWEGTSLANKLYFDSSTGLISGTTQTQFRSTTNQYRDIIGKVICTITHVRRSK